MNDHAQDVLGKFAIAISVAGIFLPLMMVILVMVTQSPPQYHSDMKRLAFFAIPLFCIASPASAADLDGLQYRERDTYYERPEPPRVVDHENG